MRLPQVRLPGMLTTIRVRYNSAEGPGYIGKRITRALHGGLHYFNSHGIYPAQWITNGAYVELLAEGS